MVWRCFNLSRVPSTLLCQLTLIRRRRHGRKNQWSVFINMINFSWISHMFLSEVVLMWTYFIWEAGRSKWEQVWCGQTVQQTASQAIIHPEGQTGNMPSHCSPSRWGRSAPAPALVGVLQENRNNYRAGASGGPRCWLSNRRCRVVTAFCCLSEKMSFTWAKKISSVLPLSAEKLLYLKTLCSADVKYFTRV